MAKRKRYWVCVDDGMHPINFEQAVKTRDFFSEEEKKEEALVLADGDPRLKQYKNFNTMDLE